MNNGKYITPAERAKLREQEQGKTDFDVRQDTQNSKWNKLKRDVNLIINQVNSSNLQSSVILMFEQNLVRGRGWFCKMIMQAQNTHPAITPVYAAFVAIINTKVPDIGELLLHRLVMNFSRAYVRNDKTRAITLLKFIAHLVNQYVATHMLALELLITFLEKPTSDSVILSCEFLEDIGAFLTRESPEGMNGVYTRLREIVQSPDTYSISSIAQFSVERLMKIIAERFVNRPSTPESLDILDIDEQITHQVSVGEKYDEQSLLDVFCFEENFEENESAWNEIKLDILGPPDDEQSDRSNHHEGRTRYNNQDQESDESESDSEHDDENKVIGFGGGNLQDAIVSDETRKMEFRRLIYTTIMSSLTSQEAIHKLLKLDGVEGRENEMVEMIIECCGNQKAYSKMYGEMGSRLGKLTLLFSEVLEESFIKYYGMMHQFTTVKIRNIAMFYTHILATDAMDWTVFKCIQLTEEDTTSATRIFIKILLTELARNLTMKVLERRLTHRNYSEVMSGLFPEGNPKKVRFAVNYLTTIGLGSLTTGMREYLRDETRVMADIERLERLKREEEGSGYDSDSDSGSDDSGSDDSTDSDSDSDYYRSRRSRRSPSSSRSPSPVRPRSSSYSSSDRSPRSPSPYSSRSPTSRRNRSSSSSSRSPQRNNSSTSSRSPRRSYSRTPSRSPRRTNKSSPSRRTPSRTPSRSPNRRNYSPSRSKSSHSRSPHRYTRSKSPRRYDSRSRTPSKTRSRTPPRTSRRSYSHSQTPTPTRSRSLSPPPLSREHSPVRSNDDIPPLISPTNSNKSPSSPSRSSTRRSRSRSPSPNFRKQSRSLTPSRSRSPRRRRSRSPCSSRSRSPQSPANYKKRPRLD